MTDVIDRAQFAEQVARDDALARILARAAYRLPARTHCVDCAAPIDPRRLAALPHAQRCTGCQIEKEQSQ